MWFILWSFFLCFIYVFIETEVWWCDFCPLSGLRRLDGSVPGLGAPEGLQKTSNHQVEIWNKTQAITIYGKVANMWVMFGVNDVHVWGMGTHGLYGQWYETCFLWLQKLFQTNEHLKTKKRQSSTKTQDIEKINTVFETHPPSIRTFYAKCACASREETMQGGSFVHLPSTKILKEGFVLVKKNVMKHLLENRFFTTQKKMPACWTFLLLVVEPCLACWFVWSPATKNSRRRRWSIVRQFFLCYCHLGLYTAAQVWSSHILRCWVWHVYIHFFISMYPIYVLVLYVLIKC